ncbi:proton-conducting transporter membrane subunit [Luteimonas vadosa]|uniref:Proton-conducting transporter membrane subunit n=2 Tax=Luteimonas vadosa TaxID=1165507 RepID=A0ABP9DNN1_9GAMM
MVIAIPFIGALVIALAHGAPRLRQLAGWLAAAAFLAGVLGQVGPVLEGQGRGQLLWEIVPGLRIAFRVEPLGLLFALIAATLWPVAMLYANRYMDAMGYKHLGRFFACYALAIGSAAGVAFADNLLTLFVFYEVLSLSTYPLVTHTGTENARRGGKTYLLYLLGSSICFLLVAMLWTWDAAGTLDFRAGGVLAGKVDAQWLPLLAGLFVFGIGKAAVMPMHRWLPAAMVAPAPVSALLHAVAVVKAGVFAVLKVAVYIFGADLLTQTGAGIWLSWFAAYTIVAASLVAMTRDDLKARLAYSTISQLSYVVLGAMVATPLAIIGAAMQVAVHAFAKITLFFGAGAIQVAHGFSRVSQLDGLGRHMPYTFGAFTVGTLSIVGLPLFGGMWAKWYLIAGSLQAHQWVLVAALLLSSLLNIVYLLAIPFRAFFLKPAPGVAGIEGVDEAPWPLLAAMLLTASACVVLFFFPGPLHRLAAMLVEA